ncbi:hypothetical protein KKF84_03035 [Myxococcota bacterium]|nr:hypothetical protein [Myxococcota bacterium]MBU1534264.1 hypothetical protein [Myxococcota bacterium]
MKYLLALTAMLFLHAACTVSGPTGGATYMVKGSPILMVRAGSTVFGQFYYIIDSQTKVCLLSQYSTNSQSSVKIPCCRLKRMQKVAPFITWESSGCEGAGYYNNAP